VIYPLTMQEWKRFDAAHPAPTFFARPAWALALMRAYPHFRPYPVCVGDSSGDLVVPLMQVTGGTLGWKAFVAMPFGSYTCGLRDDGTLATPAAFSRALAAIARECDSLNVTPWPLLSVDPMPAWRRTSHCAAVVDLEGGAEAAIRGFSGVSRRMAGQAERHGVECRPCDSPGVAATTYYAILREAAGSWDQGHPPFGKELLEALIAHGDGDVEIWLAQCDAHPIAGGVVLYGAAEAFFWSAAMRRSFARLRPSNALNVALVKAAAARKKRWYNLGASEGLPGVERFKRGLGARMLPYGEFQREGVAFAVYSRLRGSLLRARDGKSRSAQARHGARTTA
jgi:hypothetical protein